MKNEQANKQTKKKQASKKTNQGGTWRNGNETGVTGKNETK